MAPNVTGPGPLLLQRGIDASTLSGEGTKEQASGHRSREQLATHVGALAKLRKHEHRRQAAGTCCRVSTGAARGHTVVSLVENTSTTCNSSLRCSPANTLRTTCVSHHRQLLTHQQRHSALHLPPALNQGEETHMCNFNKKHELCYTKWCAFISSRDLCNKHRRVTF